MSWAHDITDALLETLEGTADGPMTIAAIAIDGDDESIALTSEEHRDGLFEIGSITKTMTATVLALLAEQVVTLDAPIGTWLDAGDNGSITLEQLAKHTSGLPRMASNYEDWDGYTPDDPYAGFGPAEAEKGLRAASCTDVGAVAYSNFGYQLLGMCLERASGSPLSWLLDHNLFEPLDMVTATAAFDAVGIPGHADGSVTAPWRLLLPGPGGVRAGAADMAAYLRGVLRPPAGELGAAITAALSSGLGWVRHAQGFDWHNGGTGGFRTMLAADRDAGRGVAVLVSTADIEPDAAVVLAITGQDPRSARLEPVGDEWAEPALAMVACLVAGDFEGATADMTADTAAVLTPERLRSAWEPAVADLGAVGPATLASVGRASGAVRANVDLQCASAKLTVEVFIDDAHKIIGAMLR